MLNWYLTEFGLGTGAEENNSKFHHWHEGDDAGAAIHLTEPKLIWCSAQNGQEHQVFRQVWDGGDIVANNKPSQKLCQVSAIEPFKIAVRFLRSMKLSCQEHTVVL